MGSPATKSRRPARRFWGWGAEQDTLFPPEEAAVAVAVAALGSGPAGPVPCVEEFALAQPRVAPPAALAEMFSATPLDRLNHAGGKSYADLARMWLRQPPNVPDWVAYPADEDAVVAVLEWASGAGVAVVPYGGGSSVAGGVEPPSDGFAASVSLDMELFSRVVEVDRVSRAALIEGGAYRTGYRGAIAAAWADFAAFSSELCLFDAWRLDCHAGGRAFRDVGDAYRRFRREHAHGDAGRHCANAAAAGIRRRTGARPAGFGIGRGVRGYYARVDAIAGPAALSRRGNVSVR